MIKFSKKYLIAIIFIITLILSVIYFNNYYSKSNAINVIKKKIGLDIPKTSTVIFFDHTFIGDYFDAKIKITYEDIDNIIEQLNDDSKFPKLKKDNSNLNIPNFQNTCEWFVINNENLKYLYSSYRTDKEFKDKEIHEIWAFICYESQEYYLYLSF